MLGVLPHSYSESIVPFCDTDEGEYLITLLDGFGSSGVDPNSMPTFIASYPRFFFSVNIIHRTALFVSHLLNAAFTVSGR